MNWNYINSPQDLDTVKQQSLAKPVMIFKHSTSCGISSMAINRLERNWKEDEMTGVEIYYLDLLGHRDLSQLIAQTFNVRHESPQVLIIKDEQCVYHDSHMGINYQTIKSQLEQVKN